MHPWDLLKNSNLETLNRKQNTNKTKQKNKKQKTKKTKKNKKKTKTKKLILAI